MKKLLVWRIVLSCLILVGLFVFTVLYERSRGPLEGNVAVMQLEDSNAAYIASRSIANGDTPRLIEYVFVGIPLLLIWGSFLYGVVFSKKDSEKE